MDDNAYFGKYRGIVSNNKDPENLGRIKALVPDVFDEDECDWALPALPFGGSGLGFFAVPDEKANVWIEFEGGDPECPIWTGCFWLDSNDIPRELLSPKKWQSDKDAKMRLLIKTKDGQYLLLDDDSSNPAVTLQTSGGQKITIGSDGIVITIGDSKSTVKLDGNSRKVTINDDGLEVD